MSVLSRDVSIRIIGRHNDIAHRIAHRRLTVEQVVIPEHDSFCGVFHAACYGVGHERVLRGTKYSPSCIAVGIQSNLRDEMLVDSTRKCGKIGSRIGIHAHKCRIKPLDTDGITEEEDYASTLTPELIVFVSTLL